MGNNKCQDDGDQELGKHSKPEEAFQASVTEPRPRGLAGGESSRRARAYVTALKDVDNSTNFMGRPYSLSMQQSLPPSYQKNPMP